MKKTLFILGLGLSGYLLAGEGLPQLDVAYFPTQIFWLIIVFSLLYLILSKFLLPKIADVMVRRSDLTSFEKNKSQELLDRVSYYSDKREEIIAEANSVARGYIENATKSNEEYFKKQDKSRRDNMEEKIKEFSSLLDVRKEAIKEELKGSISELVDESKGKLELTK